MAVPLRGAAGIALRGHDHRDRGLGPEPDRPRRQPALRGGEQQRQQILVEPQQDGLGFGIAEPDVELDQLRSRRGQHQAGEQHALERRAARLHPGQRRLDDLAHDAGLERRRHGRSRRDGAHAAGVGAGVAVADPLVVLAEPSGSGLHAVAQGEERDFLALEELLDHHGRAGRPEAARRT